MRDLISIDDLSLSDIEQIHQQAAIFLKTPHQHFSDLKDKTLINFFFENSTRTRISFETAAQRMGVKVVNLDVSLSSLKKGESIIDTAKTINAMNPDFVVIRHNSSGIVELLKKHFNSSLINAGDGTNEHPSQALLDAFVIKENNRKTPGKIAGLKIVICGDILHSRVAHSNIKLLKKLGAEISVVTLPTLMPKNFAEFLQEKFQIKTFNKLDDAVENADVIMMLRIQQERMQGCYIPSLSEYFECFGMNHQKLKLAPNAIIMHPGPINRDVEISCALADDEKVSMILNQVEAGVAVRQAILKFLS